MNIAITNKINYCGKIMYMCIINSKHYLIYLHIYIYIQDGKMRDSYKHVHIH